MQKKLINIFSIFILFILFGITLFCIFDGENVQAEEIVKTNPKTVYVDIKGAVNNPGVYEVDYGSRIIDQTTPNMIQRISGIFERNPLISKEI